MTEDERASFEETLIADQDFSDTVAACEQDMIDSCAAANLPPEESTAVREWIAASPRRTQRLRSAQSLLRTKQKNARSHQRAVILTIAACLFMVVGLSIVRFEQAGRRPPAASSLESSPVGLRTSSPGAVSSRPGKAVVAAALLLVAERTRGDLPEASYRIPQDVPVHVEVLLSGVDAGGSYELKIDSSDKSHPIVLERQNLSARESGGQIFVDATFAAGSLPPAIYQARVSSGQRIMIARFVVTR